MLPKLARDLEFQAHEAKNHPIISNQSNFSKTHNNKNVKNQRQRENPKGSKRKDYNVQGNLIGYQQISAETLQAGREWDLFKGLKEKNVDQEYYGQILGQNVDQEYSAKLFFRNER